MIEIRTAGGGEQPFTAGPSTGRAAPACGQLGPARHHRVLYGWAELIRGEELRKTRDLGATA
jgi:hypothetical protein